METFEILNIIGPIGNKMFFKQQKQHLYYLYYCFWQTEKKKQIEKFQNHKQFENCITPLVCFQKSCFGNFQTNIFKKMFKHISMLSTQRLCGEIFLLFH